MEKILRKVGMQQRNSRPRVALWRHTTGMRTRSMDRGLLGRGSEQELKPIVADSSMLQNVVGTLPKDAVSMFERVIYRVGRGNVHPVRPVRHTGHRHRGKGGILRTLPGTRDASQGGKDCTQLRRRCLHTTPARWTKTCARWRSI